MLQAQKQAATVSNLCKLLEPDSVLKHSDQGQRSIMCSASLPSPSPQVNRKNSCAPEDVFMLQTFCM